MSLHPRYLDAFGRLSFGPRVPVTTIVRGGPPPWLARICCPSTYAPGRDQPARSATPNMAVWHRVIVLIEADVRCLADCDRHLLNDRIWIVRQLQKVRCLRGKGFADRDGVLIRQRRSAAAPQHQSSACALRSSTSVNWRPAKKPSRT